MAALILFTYSRTSGRQVNSLYAPHIIRFQWSTLDGNTENRSFHDISIDFHVQTSHFSNSTCQNKKAATIQTFTNLRLTCGPLAGWRVQCPTWYMSANHIAQLTILGGNFPATWVVLDGKTLMAEKKSKNLDKLKITARLPRASSIHHLSYIWTGGTCQVNVSSSSRLVVVSRQSFEQSFPPG